MIYTWYDNNVPFLIILLKISQIAIFEWHEYGSWPYGSAMHENENGDSIYQEWNNKVGRLSYLIHNNCN